MEPPMQSVGQDCEATPPLLRHHHPGGRQPLAQNNYYSSGPGEAQNARQLQQQPRQYAAPAVVRHSPHARR